MQGWLATLLNMVVKYVTPCGAATPGDIETAELIKVCGRYITPETGQRGVPIFVVDFVPTAVLKPKWSTL